MRALLVLLLSVSVATAGERPNVLLFFIDTLRADHVGCYGYQRNTTPTLDALAGRGTLFETAIAQSTWSLPSYATVFTSVYPTVHGVNRMSDALGPQWQTLAEVVRLHGYRTVAFTGGGHCGPEFGLQRGFDVFDAAKAPASCARSVAGARRWLEARAASRDTTSPFLMFAHGYDVHAPYSAPLGFTELFDPGYSGIVHHPGFLREEFLRTIADSRFDPCDLLAAEEESFPRASAAAGWRQGPGGLPLRLPPFTRELAPADRRHLVAHYDGALRYADAWLAVLLDSLEQAGELHRTVVVVAGDHGEHLLERGHIGHNGPPDEAAIRVPLVFAGPDVASGRRVADVAGLIDLGPTILQLCGIPKNERHQGESLAPYLSPSSPPPDNPKRAAFSATNRVFSIRTREWHLIQRMMGHIVRERDLSLHRPADDPYELIDLVAKQPGVTDALRSRLQDWRDEYDKQAPAARSLLDAAKLELFRQFGYW